MFGTIRVGPSHTSRKRKLTFFIEVIAQCSRQWLFHPELGIHYWSFVDNVGARFALTKGYSRDRDAEAIASLLWNSVAARGTAPWFEHVPSKAQLADAVCRAGLDGATAHDWRGWQADVNGIWRLMCDLLSREGIADLKTSNELQVVCDEIRSQCTPISMGKRGRRQLAA